MDRRRRIRWVEISSFSLIEVDQATRVHHFLTNLNEIMDKLKRYIASNNVNKEEKKKKNYFFDSKKDRKARYEYRDFSFLKDLPLAHDDPYKCPNQPNVNPFVELKESMETRRFDKFLDDYKTTKSEQEAAMRREKDQAGQTFNSSASTSTSQSSSKKFKSSTCMSTSYGHSSEVYNDGAGCSSWPTTNSTNYNQY